MTFKYEKTNDGYSYLLLDDFVERLVIYSKDKLEANDIDIICNKILVLGSQNGIINTEKGEVTYSLTHKTWEDISINEKQND